MTSNLEPSIIKELNNTRPPYFDGKDYDVWKNKMKAFIKSIDNLMWEVVQIGRAHV